ncbi:hypothetical protein APHAL10511_008226 [Amanita phalloides]|nr:hypothetical protein APHAL10511_008226 [Amanita phalloides]
MDNTIAGPAATALKTLSADQIAFIQSLPKAELHAHLNGSIPLKALRHLANEYLSPDTLQPYSKPISDEDVISRVEKLSNGITLDQINDFFTLFPAINALTATRGALAYATRAVLSEFLDGESPQCHYLELRSTPKQTMEMTREEYIRVVLHEVEKYPSDRAALLVSLDRRMNLDVMKECADAAEKLNKEGRRVVGIDLCGDPRAGEVDSFEPIFEQVRNAGLGITLHIAETIHNSGAETLKLLSYKPQRLGHATFLTEEHQKVVHDNQICIEISLSSNLLCKTVSSLDAHHIKYYIHHGHPVAICTDDILPFRTSLLGEYALLMAQPPLGLGLSEEEHKIIIGCPYIPAQQTSDDSEDEESTQTAPNSIGPQIPTQSWQPKSTPHPPKNEDEDGDDDGVSEPMPNRNVPKSPPRQASSSGPSMGRRPIGPTLPPQISQQHHITYDEDEDDEIGPRPPPPGRHQEVEDAVKRFMEVEETRRKKIEEAAKPKALQREEWMLKPPSSSDLLGSLDPSRLKAPRQFSRSTAPPRKADNSLWTETPAEKQQRLADEVMGKRRRVVDLEPDGDDNDDEKKRRRKDEEHLRRGVEAYTERVRGPSLLKQHASSEKKKETDGDELPVIWDHERDMGIGGRLMDDDKRNRFIKEARGLGDRFSSGKSGFL